MRLTPFETVPTDYVSYHAVKRIWILHTYSSTSYKRWRWLVLFWDKVITKSEHLNLKMNADGRKLSVNFELRLCKQSGQQIALFTSLNHEIRNLPSAECYSSLEAAKHKKCISG